jgi:hypothetical protein
MLLRKRTHSKLQQQYSSKSQLEHSPSPSTASRSRGGKKNATKGRGAPKLKPDKITTQHGVRQNTRKNQKYRGQSLRSRFANELKYFFYC